jgi:hypothetical protein
MMTDVRLQPLPLGNSNFETMRKAGQIYVDKTRYVYDLASVSGKFFLARPRRFGKSLLVSTFDSLFRHGLTHFKGLAIEKLWKDDNQYRVVRLDFSESKEFKDAADFTALFNEVLLRAFTPCGFRFDSSSSISLTGQLSDWLGSFPLNSLVLLIDEYDAPLNAALDNPELFAEVRRYMTRFYAALKSNDGALRFLFITGITKFHKTTLFSDLNNVSDISLSPTFGSLLGYTHEEVEQYFGGYLTKISQDEKMDRSLLVDELTRNYDGFCFECTAKQKVFCPWSLLKYFNDPREGFRDFWIESGGRPAALYRYLNSHYVRDIREYEMQSMSLYTLSSAVDVENISDIGLLTQTGYLTIKAVEYGDTVYVDFPNQEVRRALAQIFVEQLLKGRTAGMVGAGPIYRALEKESAEAVVNLLNKLFCSIDYQNYPIHDEAAVRAYVQVYMTGANLSPKAEVHNYRGRSDLEVTVGNRHWVFEFKAEREEGKGRVLLKEAEEQLLSRNYGSASDAAEVKRLALVFSLQKRQFVSWKEI